ncbi:MAG: hypothetical protein DRO87_10930 [Candidatus Thorarchaeota archaeon]|nr:MAG: hypothetical protein DRO87_10930 [Candidatus Thorarchaeota archaeon]
MLAIVVIAVVVVGFVVVLRFNNMAPMNQTNMNTRNLIDYDDQDVDLFPAYYRFSFNVKSSETETPQTPWVDSSCSIDTATDDVDVVFHWAVYATDIATIDAASTWSELDTYLVNERDHTYYASYPESYGNTLELYGHAESYTLVFWFEASDKNDVWSVDISFDLNYYVWA